MSLYFAMKSLKKIYDRTLDLMSEINTGKDVSASIEEIEDLSQDVDLALNEITSSWPHRLENGRTGGVRTPPMSMA